MINRDELVHIGHFRKPHGTKGEIGFSFAEGIADQVRNDISALVIADLTRNPLTETGIFFICEIDGIFVPFRIAKYRSGSGSSAYIQLKTVDSEAKARELAHKEVFMHKKHSGETIEDDSFTWDYFTGFTLVDEQLGKIGTIIDVDTTTINTLFIVEKGNEEILIPAAEDFIIQINENQKELRVELPDGLV